MIRKNVQILIVAVLVIMMSLFASCKNSPDQQVIRNFYSEYYESCDNSDDSEKVLEKYCSELMLNQLDSCSNPDVLDYNPFFNNQDPTGFAADSIRVVRVRRDTYRVTGSTITDTVMLRMNKFHKIDRVLSI